MRAVIALGANLGDREHTLGAALREIAELPQTTLEAASGFYESAAVKPDGIDLTAPSYLNQVAEVETKTGDNATLRLQAIRDGHREGEMSLQLYWGERFLYSVTFLLVANADRCEMLVTRLQGSRDDDAKDLIRQATKSFHGYRPSVLLLQAVRQLAHDCGCHRV